MQTNHPDVQTYSLRPPANYNTLTHQICATLLSTMSAPHTQTPEGLYTYCGFLHYYSLARARVRDKETKRTHTRRILDTLAGARARASARAGDSLTHGWKCETIDKTVAVAAAVALNRRREICVWFSCVGVSFFCVCYETGRRIFYGYRGNRRVSGYD